MTAVVHHPPIHWLVPWTPPSSTPPELPVTTIEEGGYIVRGTVDELAAMRAVIAYQLAEEHRDGDSLSVPPLNRVGWFRWNPCSPNNCWNGGGHTGHLDYKDGSGRGRWQGVYFTW